MSEPIDWHALTPEERNAIIAEKVMGRSIDRSRTFGQLLIARDDKPGLTMAVPRYATDLNAAWLIVTSHRFSKVQLAYYEGWKKSEEERWQAWRCDITSHAYPASYGGIPTASGETPAEAVCIAALRACGYEVTV